MKNPASAAGTARSFMDGMHDYILTNRRTEFNKLRVDLPIFDEVSSSCVVLFHTSSQPIIQDLSSAGTVSRVVMDEVEKAVYAGIHGSLFSCMKSSVKVEETVLQRRVSDLKHKSQRFFGVEVR